MLKLFTKQFPGSIAITYMFLDLTDFEMILLELFHLPKNSHEA